jgi:hypothetical protein
MDAISNAPGSACQKVNYQVNEKKSIQKTIKNMVPSRSSVQAAIPTHPGILASSIFLPAGTLILLSVTLWNYYRIKNGKTNTSLSQEENHSSDGNEPTQNS